MGVRSREEQQIGFPLVISFLVIMCQELSDGVPQRGLAEEYQLGQALAFDGTHASFGKGIQIAGNNKG